MVTDVLVLVSAYSWPVLLGAVFVLGFAPGFTLRVILLCYPRGHPRRRELLAELYSMSRIERLLFVAEQLEVALFEGLPLRIGRNETSDPIHADNVDVRNPLIRYRYQDRDGWEMPVSPREVDMIIESAKRSEWTGGPVRIFDPQGNLIFEGRSGSGEME